MITRALRESDGNRSEAARRLGVHRQLLYAKAQKFGIDIGEASEHQTEGVANSDKPRSLSCCSGSPFRKLSSRAARAKTKPRGSRIRPRHARRLF